MLLTGDIATMTALCERVGDIPQVTVGGIHHQDGRTARLRYVFLSRDEEAALRALSARGVRVVAQDVPSAQPVPLEAMLAGDGKD